MPSLARRLYQYQKERFPIAVHLPLIAAFSFSAIGYSRALRGADGFIPLVDFISCAFTNVTMFFLLRVADEHKDKEDDALYRTYLPVPRGLVSLKELSTLAWILFAVATAVNVFFYPQLLALYAFVMLYLVLMRYEFWIKDWLKKHQVAYILSHMFIIPIADIYASSYDWKLSGAEASIGLVLFFVVSYLNGLILEIGRKMRVNSTEEYGVVSYTKLWGKKGAPIIWLLLLIADMTVAWVALHYAGYGVGSFYALIILAIMIASPALLFIAKPTKGMAKGIEIMSLLCTLGMYLLLGGIPLLIKLLSGGA